MAIKIGTISKERLEECKLIALKIQKNQRLAGKARAIAAENNNKLFTNNNTRG